MPNHQILKLYDKDKICYFSVKAVSAIPLWPENSKDAEKVKFFSCHIIHLCSEVLHTEHMPATKLCLSTKHFLKME